MNYTALQLVERALNLADIANTDFLTYKEIIQYLNDAWTSCYQWLINQGDKQFITEATLVGSKSDVYTAYELPDDFYQLRSLGDRYGNLIHRKADSEDAGYEIVNNEIRVYSKPVNELIATYYRKPTFLSVPNRPIEFNRNDAILDWVNDSVLLATGDIVNVVTGELIASIAVEEADYTLGNGVYVVTSDNLNTVYNFNGKALNVIEGQIYIHKDRSGTLYYQTLEDSKYTAPKNIINNNELLTVIDNEADGYPEYIASYQTRGEWLSYSASDSTITVYKEEEDEEFDIPMDVDPRLFAWAEDFDNSPCFYVTNSRNKVYVYSYSDNGDVETDEIKQRPALILALLRYGLLESDGTYSQVKSVIPDTDMNFPNEVYFSLIACDLAVRFATKMNSNVDGLNNLYANMQYNFMNTLGQDADYPRIKNVY